MSYMPKEEMVEQIQKEFKLLPDRKSLKHECEIFGKNKFTIEENEIDLDLDPFKRLPTENILF